MIPITRPYLPSKASYHELVDGIWERNYLTNNGPLVVELENRLREYLDLEQLLFVGNGTIALQIAIKALGLTGKVITTPFSYVATTSSLIWEGCEAEFVDIDADTFNIDPEKIEEAITDEVSAILATHVYGNPCAIDQIERIGREHGLQVIYDAAHCFRTGYRGRSVFEYGDISITSFHATKLFHTIEGGAIISQDAELMEKMEFMRNFGHDGPENFAELGINGKNSEFHAAMGLCVLDEIDQVLETRKKQWRFYESTLDSSGLRLMELQPHSEFNFSYFPVVFESEVQLKTAVDLLLENDIYPRRYFYPLLSELDYVGTKELPVASSVSRRVLCLPLYHDLKEENQTLICNILKNALVQV